MQCYARKGDTKGGLVVVGQLNLGGSLDMVYNAVNLAEIAVEKGATTLLIPLNARKQLNDLSDEMITKINIQYYTDLKDCFNKGITGVVEKYKVYKYY